MTEEDRKRMKVLEENVFELKGISVSLKQLVEKDVEHIKDELHTMKGEVTILKKHDEDFTHAMYESCDNKTKEINHTVEAELTKALTPIREKATGNRNAVYGLFTLFIGALAWVTLQNTQLRSDMVREDGRIHEKINAHIEKSSVTKGNNTATIEAIFKELQYIKEKVDKH